LDRDVLAQRPTLVTLLAGANDAHHGVAAADYGRQVQRPIAATAPESCCVPSSILPASRASMFDQLYPDSQHEARSHVADL
jgi:hypothetical protein